MSTPAMPEPFATIHEAIADKLLVEGITCYDHLPLELYGAPSAYLTATDALAAFMGAAQGELLIGEVPYSLKYFVSLEQDPRIAWIQLYEGARAMYRAFSDGSLGGRVRAAQVERVSFDPVEMGSNRRPMLLAEASLKIKPAAYA